MKKNINISKRISFSQTLKSQTQNDEILSQIMQMVDEIKPTLKSQGQAQALPDSNAQTSDKKTHEDASEDDSSFVEQV